MRRFGEKVKKAIEEPIEEDEEDEEEDDDEESFEETPQTPLVPKAPKSFLKDKAHFAGELEPIIDVVGWRVWENEKDSVEVSRDNLATAKILQSNFKILKLASGN